MQAFPSRLEITVQLVDGSASRFVQTGRDAIMAIPDSYDLIKLFDEPHISINRPEGVLIYTTSKVVRVDFAMDVDPKWKFPKLGAEFWELTYEQFKNRRDSRKNASPDGAKPSMAGNEYRGLAHLHLPGNIDAYLELRTELKKTRREQAMLLSSVLEGSTIFCPRASGGYAFLNLANILRFDLLHRQPDSAPEVLKTIFSG